MLVITPDVSIPDEEFEWKFIRSSGPGGQNVNKVASAVQLRFLLPRNVSLPASASRYFPKAFLVLPPGCRPSW